MFPIEIWNKLLKGFNLTELYYVSLVNKNLRKLIITKLEKRFKLFDILFKKDLIDTKYINIFFLELKNKDYLAAQYIFKNKLNKIKNIFYIDEVYDYFKIDDYHIKLILNEKKGDKNFYLTHIDHFDILDDNFAFLMIENYHSSYPKVFWKNFYKIYVDIDKPKTSEYFLSILSQNEVEIELGKFINDIFDNLYYNSNILKLINKINYILELFRKNLKHKDEIIDQIIKINDSFKNKIESQNNKFILNSILIQRGFNSESSRKTWITEFTFNIKFKKITSNKKSKKKESILEVNYEYEILKEESEKDKKENDEENEEESIRELIEKYYFDITKYDSEEELNKNIFKEKKIKKGDNSDSESDLEKVEISFSDEESSNFEVEEKKIKKGTKKKDTSDSESD